MEEVPRKRRSFCLISLSFLTFLEDTSLPFKKLDEFIVKYQDPKEADKLMKLEHTLKEVTDIVHKNMEDVILTRFFTYKIFIKIFVYIFLLFLLI